MRLLISILLPLLMTQVASGAVTIQSFNQARFSRGDGKLLGNAVAQTNTIYGGMAGDCTGSSGSTCNSCENVDHAADVPACNRRRIHDDLLLELTLITDTQGVVRVTNDVDDAQQTLSFTANVSTTVAIPANTTFTVSIRWKEICEKIFQLDDCGSDQTSTLLSSAQRIRIGVDSDSDNKLNSGEFATDLQIILANFTGTDAGKATLCDTGTSGDIPATCNFIAYPGDSKIFLEDVRTGCDFPGVDGSGANIEFIRVFYRDVDEGFPNIKEGEIADLQVNTENATCTDSTKVISLADNEVTGLENGTTYAFAIGVVDQAYNVGYVTDTEGSGGSLDTSDTGSCFDPDGNELGQNCHVATPDEVIGLIEDEFDCFITTATYGSPFRPKVEDFRTFRNLYLKTNGPGQALMDFYYRNSPPIANWIRNNPESKPWMRALLWPFWLFAKVCIEYPMTFVLFLISLLIIKRRNWLTGGLR